MNDILKEFVSQEPKEFKFKIGHYIASSLFGFIAGVVVVLIAWFTSDVVKSFFS